MATIDLPINANFSLQIGDTVYYCDTATIADKQKATKEDIIEIGKVISITSSSITCIIDDNTTPPTAGSFILFSKDSKANLSDLVGYYAEVKLKNNTKEPAELFSVGCDVFQSSK